MVEDVHSSVLIATIGAKPQLVTLATDCLIARGELLEQVIGVHATRKRAETAQAIDTLTQEFSSNYINIKFNPIELSANDEPLEDITTPLQVEVAFRTLYAVVRKEKLSDRKIHLLIAGGRRTLTVFGMSVAQMLFDDRDRLWHLASHPILEASARLHASDAEWARLIQIPVLPWGRLSPAFNILRSVEDPFLAEEQLRRLRLQEQWDQARIFVLTKLSGAERSVVELLTRDGLNQEEISGRLSISPRTVEQHLRSAYRKAADHWDMEDINQTRLVRLLSLYFVTGGGGTE